MRFQTPLTAEPDRKDHVFRRVGFVYKCVLCGAVTRNPPRYPTPAGWLPDRYDRLGQEDRAACPPGR